VLRRGNNVGIKRLIEEKNFQTFTKLKRKWPCQGNHERFQIVELAGDCAGLDGTPNSVTAQRI
jgi:hypothetical protein